MGLRNVYSRRAITIEERGYRRMRINQPNQMIANRQKTELVKDIGVSILSIDIM